LGDSAQAALEQSASSAITDGMEHLFMRIPSGPSPA
jgi:hypothetical protein